MVAPARTVGACKLDWLDPLKAFALLGILLNHLVEEFGRGPWFTNPWRDWPSLEERLRTFFPVEDPVWIAVPRFLGWLGDAGPGVFIFASGLGLAFAMGTSARQTSRWIPDFYSRRLAKLLPAYWAAHLLVAGSAALLPVSLVNLGSLDSLLSLAGLRLTPSAFFHINPSWWFVWTIVQLYLLFPLLVMFKDRFGAGRLLITGVVVTIAARGIGILYVDALYYWMSGLNALTRLGEFTLGMWAAEALIQRGGTLPVRLSTARGALLPGMIFYAVGLASSTFLPSTLISNLAVTAGLCLLFLAGWHALRSASPQTVRRLTWFGAHSYGAYLIHQPFVKWAAQLGAPYGAGVALAASMAVIAMSVPVGAWLERGSARVHGWLSKSDTATQQTGFAISVCLLLLLSVVDPLLQPWFGRPRASFQILLVAGLLSLIVIELAARRGRPDPGGWLRWWALSATFAGVWIVPPGEAHSGVLAALPVALLARAVLALSGIRVALAMLAGCAVIALLA